MHDRFGDVLICFAELYYEMWTAEPLSILERGRVLRQLEDGRRLVEKLTHLKCRAFPSLKRVDWRTTAARETPGPGPRPEMREYGSGYTCSVLTLETVWEEYSHHFEGQDSRANIKRWPGKEGDDAGCGRENTSRIDPIDQGSAVVSQRECYVRVKKGRERTKKEREEKHTDTPLTSVELKDTAHA
ncbi:hypothetical protein B0H14DRAFT_2614222 [Mycena olivaceomarginata]|nr:hypothetical protein B0H14DRAFT_2614222 [Mycena olivaceomarginata]